MRSPGMRRGDNRRSSTSADRADVGPPVTNDALGYPLNEWASLALRPKALFSWPDWQTPSVFVESKAAATRAGRSRFMSHEAERCRLHVQLMDESGAALEGMELLLMMWRNRPLIDMTAALNILHEGKFICIARIDARPEKPHTNIFWRRFGCPPEIAASHHHPFAQNASIGRKAFDPYKNLPVAYPLDTEPEHLRDFLQVVEQAFKIEGLVNLPPPPTQGSLI